jgi:nitronate monooxygenase
MTVPSVSGVRSLPWLIQGGMGIAISNWTLARAVSRSGQLGVVSGTGIETVFVRRLQDDGVDERLQAVLDEFPLQSVVADAMAKFNPSRRGGRDLPYRVAPMSTHRNVQSSQDLLVLASYAEVALAKAGHDGAVGINLLTKVQIPTVPTLFGAMLAGVDYRGSLTSCPGARPWRPRSSWRARRRRARFRTSDSTPVGSWWRAS